MTSDDDGYSRSEVKRLEGWLSFPEAAEVLGVSKQMIHKMVFSSGLFNLETEVRSVGDRPIYVVDEKKVRALKATRKAHI